MIRESNIVRNIFVVLESGHYCDVIQRLVTPKPWPPDLRITDLSSHRYSLFLVRCECERLVILVDVFPGVQSCIKRIGARETGPVWEISTSRHTPVPLSGGYGFQSTNPIAESSRKSETSYL
ncbi:hypothetical protein TMatcc_004953 [Talaromyces marneffei ATCC 18224]